MLNFFLGALYYMKSKLFLKYFVHDYSIFTENLRMLMQQWQHCTKIRNLRSGFLQYLLRKFLTKNFCPLKHFNEKLRFCGLNCFNEKLYFCGLKRFIYSLNSFKDFPDLRSLFNLVCERGFLCDKAFFKSYPSAFLFPLTIIIWKFLILWVFSV